MKKLVLILTAMILVPVFASAENIIDNFENISAWEPISEGVNLRSARGYEGRALCLDYRLGDGKDWVVAGKNFGGKKLPDNFKISFYLKGEGPSNTVEIKFLDRDGNVFWKKLPDLSPPQEWTRYEIEKNRIEFAWGPEPGADLTHIESMEIAIVKGSGGSGTICIDRLAYTPLEGRERTRAGSAPFRVTATASSIELPHLEPQNAVDGNFGTRWASDFSDPQWIKFDFGREIEIVGLIIYWEMAYGRVYDIQVSDDGREWETVFTERYGLGGTDDIDFEMVSRRYLRIYGRQRGTGWGYSILNTVFKTGDEPFGVGMPDPDMVLKINWNTSENPERSIFVPEHWQGYDTLLWLSDRGDLYDISVNGVKITGISPDDRQPVRLTVKEGIKFGEFNTFSVDLKETAPRGGVVDAIMVARDEEALRKELSRKMQESDMEYYRMLADMYPRGFFPMWLSHMQQYWNIIGTEGAFNVSLLTETGQLSAFTRSFSLMPYLFTGGRLISYNDVDIELSLEENYLPITQVKWIYEGIEFLQKGFGFKRNNIDFTGLIYTLENKSGETKEGKVFISIRPFLVNPPWQHGGLAQVESIVPSSRNQVIKVNDNGGVISLQRPDGFGAMGYGEGDVVELLYKGALPSASSVRRDSAARASAALSYDYSLAPGETKQLLFVLPLNHDPARAGRFTESLVMETLEEVRADWKEKLNRIEVNIPNPKIFDSMRSNLAYILINKDGDALQPGSRAYEHSWIRDSSVMAAALLRANLGEYSRRYALWISEAVESDGRVPHILNARTRQPAHFGQDWNQWDGQGAYVFTVADYYNFTGDREFARQTFPAVRRSLEFSEMLRRQKLHSRYEGTPEYGLLPISESHEGYIGNPQQSLWDIFWVLKGWKDGQLLAEVVGKQHLIPWMKEEEEGLRSNLLRNIKMVQEKHNIRYIPASIALADFDPTSTTISVFPTYEYTYLDQESFRYTFERYYNYTMKPRFPDGPPTSYTPYEIRNISPFLFLGEKEKALNSYYYLIGDQRPPEWNHWGEIVHPDYRTPAYVGDMPHSWIGAGLVNTTRNMFVYEEDNMLLLGMGIDEDWLSEEISISNFPTHYGTIGYSMDSSGMTVRMRFEGDAAPPEGFMLKSPYLERTIRRVRIDGSVHEEFTDNEIYFDSMPREVEIIY